MTKIKDCERLSPDQSHHGDDENKKPNPKMKIYKFTQLQTATFRTNLTLALITKGFKAWEEADALYTDATIEEIDWITGFKNHFAAA